MLGFWGEATDPVAHDVGLSKEAPAMHVQGHRNPPKIKIKKEHSIIGLAHK